MNVRNVLHAARWKYRTQKLSKKSQSGHHLTTLSRYIFATKARIDNQKKLLNTKKYLLYTSWQYGELQPTSGWYRLVSFGHPANFNGFRVLASLLHRRRSTEVNQTLHDVWPSHRLVHYMYIFWGSCPVNGMLPRAKLSLRPSLAFSYIGTVTARHWSSRRQPNFAALNRGRHLYSSRRPSRWALSHISSSFFFFFLA